MRNSLFAELRRNGQLSEKKPKPTTPSNDPPPPVNFRALDRAVANRNLSESAYARIEKAFASENPDNVGEWVKDYFEGFGITTPNAAPTGAAPPNASPNNPIPASAGSPPPAPRTPVDEQKIIGLPEAEVQHLVKTKGAKWVAAKYRQELAAVKVNVKK